MQHEHLTSFDSFEWNVACRRDLQAGAQADCQVSLSRSLFRSLELILGESVLPVKHMILQAAIADFSYTPPSCVLETYL